MRKGKDKHNPPRFTEWLLGKTNPCERSHTFLGDLLEIYQEMAEDSGKFKAGMWYRMQVIHCLNSLFNNTVMGSIIMLKNMLVLTW